MISRRRFLLSAAAAPAALVSAVGCSDPPRWQRAAYRKLERSRVAVIGAAEYDGRVGRALLDGLKLFRLPVHGKRVVLKPNLVEHDATGTINTHPVLVAAAIDAFRTLGAREVVVAEGPGHHRDTEHLLTATGMHDVLRERQIRYVDLNVDDTRRVDLRSSYTTLGSLHLPETVLGADLLVSMPKMKTHHWAGVTLSMKNFFGIVPGAVYGWPKNPLHWMGIHESIVDIGSTVPVPTFAIIDGIVGMEGDGPIRGTAKRSGVILLGEDLVATDATAARLMTIEPTKITYLRRAGDFLGNLRRDHIDQIGESPDRFRRDFSVLAPFRSLKGLHD